MTTLPRAILFDLGDTLLSDRGHNPEAGIRRLLDVCTNAAEVDQDAFVKVGQEYFLEILRLQEEMARLGLGHVELHFRARLRLLVERFGLGLDLGLAEAEREYWKAATNMVPEPGVRDVFETLSALGIPAGVVSNAIFAGTTLHWELTRHGLADHLSFVMASADYGIRKPHPDLFLTAVERLDVAPGDVWFVGNSMKHDIQGALQAGLTPVWYTRRAQGNGTGYDGMQVENWGEFLEMLRGPIRGEGGD